ncbi:Plant lectins/antimicrobial peptide [Glarea lozoyensis ATCC 20868]|uniref:Plant lectins/antimicrobial peptide n=1 Tax=Glarea lozoyensis (strain ATCC 20868 / MF5171) TaxID=1116229 RepID=S3DWU6_GLAL2|nr:Plant lectins/antimicrobial peptide [Glarea lozoyensis ATCC 20868]EPE30838.1 Plant lectins/antimicrobial peptide [Glarea lozoyensis ATCC 20868]
MKTFALFWLLPKLSLCQTTTTAALSPWQTGVVTIDGTCGGVENFVCSPTWGACCSKDGICGRSSKFCDVGCQPAYGNCLVPEPAPPTPPGPGSISPDGSCSGINKYNCTGYVGGSCCSASNFCGDSAAHCGGGCQSGFGNCTTTDTNISTDGSCGSNQKSCKGSGLGACCSVANYCGDTAGHCGSGCQPGFGNCTTLPNNISTDGACGKNGKICTGSSYGACQSSFGNCTGSADISTDGSCGKNGKKCTGSSYGTCCSASGFCGTTDAFCSSASGCQSGFGTCSGATDVSTDGACGTKNGKKCSGSNFGACCSASGFCGAGTAFCDSSSGCQAGFGNCTVASGVSTDGACGGTGKRSCKGSAFGDCCSKSGFCGATSTFCDAAQGCQAGFGSCTASTSNISTDGSCGKNGKTCKGSTYGDCCSTSGFCGTGDAFCSAAQGCQANFGTCTGSDNISTDGSCGKNGKTCKGSTYGDCCSASGFCGIGDNFCAAAQGCNAEFGTCLGPNNVSTDGACGKNGKTCKGSTFGEVKIFLFVIFLNLDRPMLALDVAQCRIFVEQQLITAVLAAKVPSAPVTLDREAFLQTAVVARTGRHAKEASQEIVVVPAAFVVRGRISVTPDVKPTSDFVLGVSQLMVPAERTGRRVEGVLKEIAVLPLVFGSSIPPKFISGGTGKDFCDAGCQSAFGTCSTASSTISTDGVCGTKNSKTCVGSTFGNCCSTTGSCGSTTAHCGVGCQKGSSSACLTTNIPTVDGSCGSKSNGLTCAGGDFNGQCCSEFGYCGATATHCGTGCQKGFGKCT